MVDQKDLDVVRNVFKDKARSCEMFTSVDITKQTCDISHKFVREALHELWSSGEITSLDYTRTLERMSNGQDAFVYGPRGISASSYTNRGQTLDPATTGSDDVQYAPRDTARVISTPSNDTVPAKYLSRHTRSDGAIEIPGTLVSKINTNKGNLLYGYFDDSRKELVITTDDKPGKKATAFHVYRTGETRVPRKLVSAFFPGQIHFSVQVDGGELRVS